MPHACCTHPLQRWGRPVVPGDLVERLSLAVWCPCADRQKAFGGGRGRIRHGDWRAIYHVNGDELVVTVLQVGNRREFYR